MLPLFFWLVFLGARKHLDLEELLLPPAIAFLNFQKSGIEELITLISSISEVKSYTRIVEIGNSYLHCQSLLTDICDIGGNTCISSIKNMVFLRHKFYSVVSPVKVISYQNIRVCHLEYIAPAFFV